MEATQEIMICKFFQGIYIYIYNIIGINFHSDVKFKYFFKFQGKPDTFGTFRLKVQIYPLPLSISFHQFHVKRKKKYQVINMGVQPSMLSRMRIYC